jgi:hypothetical protein
MCLYYHVILRRGLRNLLLVSDCRTIIPMITVEPNYFIFFDCLYRYFAEVLYGK